MREPTLPPDEDKRLAVLRSLQILDTPPEERFDRITRIAVQLFKVPISLVTLIDANRQWFKSCQGLNLSETPRAISFCGHAILSDEILVIPDAKKDSGFSDNPLVTNAPHIRFYAGCPLAVSEGHKLGTLCIWDHRPRRMGNEDLKALRDLASLAEDELSNLTLSRANTLLWKSEARLHDFFENAHDLIQSVTPEGRFIYVNRAWRETLGYQEDEVPHLTLNDIIHPDSQQHCMEVFRHVLAGETVTDIEATFVAKDGRQIIVSGNSNCRIEEDGVCITRSIFRDITERKRAEEALQKAYDGLERQVQERTRDLKKSNEALKIEITERKQLSEALQASERRFRALIENSSDAIVLLSANATILYSSPSTRRLLGYAGEFIGHNVFELVHPEDQKQTKTAFAKLAQKPGEIVTAEYRVRHMDGSWRWVEGTGNNLLAEPSVQAIVINYRDITERREAEEMIQHLAFYDTLTDLPNRNKLVDRLLNAIRTDEGKGKPLALLLMDLDHFKEINDTLGHPRGDLLLQEVAKRLRGVLWERDIIARLGGDEFAVLLLRLATADDVNRAIDKLQKALETPFIIDGTPIAVEAGIGVALYPDHGKDVDTLFQRADLAMYVAKQVGSGHALYKPEYDQYSPQRLALMGELRQAIESNQLLLYYQPKVNLKTGRITGVEALVRWRHPQRGMVPPDQFIGPAEKTGLIQPLTQWVLSTAMRHCQLWHQTGIEITVSVNLSVRNLLNPNLSGQVAELLKAHGVAPGCLILEITESAIMADPARAMEVLQQIHAIGVQLSIDDFGTGYSSLSYLKRLPVHEIKVDRSFVRDMIKDENDAVIVHSTIDLAHNLRLKVVAEGVENKEIWDRLAALNCDAAQGYYMSPPLSVDELSRWLVESPWGLS